VRLLPCTRENKGQRGVGGSGAHQMTTAEGGADNRLVGEGGQELA
jgi:hypothetical protein